MKADEIPAEVFVIFTETEWPIHVVTSERHALSVRDKCAASANVSRPEQVHVWRARLEPLEEMAVTDPVPPRLVPRREPA